MVNKQNKTLKTIKLPLRNDTYSFQYSSKIDERPVIAETWEPEVAQFFMKLYPNLIDEGNSISDLHQRANFEALARSTSNTSIEEFLEIVSKLEVNND